MTLFGRKIGLHTHHPPMWRVSCSARGTNDRDPSDDVPCPSSFMFPTISPIYPHWLTLLPWPSHAHVEKCKHLEDGLHSLFHVWPREPKWRQCLVHRNGFSSLQEDKICLHKRVALKATAAIAAMATSSSLEEFGMVMLTCAPQWKRDTKKPWIFSHHRLLWMRQTANCHASDRDATWVPETSQTNLSATCLQERAAFSKETH